MNLREILEAQQVQWAKRKGITLGAPPHHAKSSVRNYVQKLEDNLFEPLASSIREQFIAGKGGELDPPGGASGNMYAVYSSSALCVNLFHYWIRFLPEGAAASTSPIDPLIKALGLPTNPVSKIDFEAPNVVNAHFRTPPHLDVQIAFREGPCRFAGIEAKFTEPYGSRSVSGLMPVYLEQKSLWRGWTHLLDFAQKLCPRDLTHRHLHAAQLIKHLLGLRNQHSDEFVLVYLWFDVPGASDALEHRYEIERFAQVLNKDGIRFLYPTYQEVFAKLPQDGAGEFSGYWKYFRERYIDSVCCKPAAAASAASA